MKVTLAEREVEIPEGTTLFALRDRFKAGADVLVLDGATVSSDRVLKEGDRVVLIRRGETPSCEELDALMAARHSPGVHETVKRATVGIAGLGGLGSMVAVALARVGVGRLIVADFDVVEPSNLNRQQYYIDQIGMPKVEALCANLGCINPFVSVEGRRVRLAAENTAQVFAETDVLVEAFDAADAKAMLLEAFRAAYPGKPIVLASGLAGYESANTVLTKKVAEGVYVVGDFQTASAPGTGLMAPRVGVAAHHQANAVLRLLLGEEP